MSLLFGACMRDDPAAIVLSAGSRSRRYGTGNSDWPVVWSPQSSLSDESGIEMDETLPGPALGGDKHGHRRRVVGSQLATRFPGYSSESSPVCPRTSQTLPGMHQRISASDGGIDREHANYQRSGDVSVADLSLFSSVPSLFEERPTPILPRSGNAAVTRSRPGPGGGAGAGQYNHTVLQDYSGSSTTTTSNTIDVLQGELVRVVHVDNGWAYVVTMDHYCGYVPASYLAEHESTHAPTLADRKHAQHRLVLLRGKPSVEGPATQLSRMLSPAHSEVSSTTVTAPPELHNTSTPKHTESHQGTDGPDGFWSSGSAACTDRYVTRSRRRTRTTEQAAKTMSLGRTGSNKEPSVNLNTQRSPTGPASSAVPPTEAGNRNPRPRSHSHSAYSSTMNDMYQLQTPTPTDFWYSDRSSSLCTPAEPFQTCRGEEVVCLYEFVASDENDLTVVAGEQLVVLNQNDDEWVWVSNGRNQQGFVPTTYVRHVAEDKKTLPSSNESSPASTLQGHYTSQPKGFLV